VHRSRLPLLAIVVAATAACATRDDSDVNAILSQDSTLVARVDVKATERQPLPAACGTIAEAAQPASANRSLAAALTRQAYDAELLGDVEKAKALLLRASGLDGTDKSAAYHLGRTSEALGDHETAMTAYCRFLTLAPTTTESAEARQRVATLSQRETQVAARSVSVGATAPRRVQVATAQPAPARRVMRARSTAATTRSRVVTRATMEDTPMPGEPVSGSTEVDVRVMGGVSDGDVVATADRSPVADQPPPSTRRASRGPSGAQTVGIGAVAGAMIGAATGRSVKSAVIGAAAGGLLGTMVAGTRMRP
jgi:hypothetical protein